MGTSLAHDYNTLKPVARQPLCGNERSAGINSQPALPAVIVRLNRWRERASGPLQGSPSSSEKPITKDMMSTGVGIADAEAGLDRMALRRCRRQSEWLLSFSEPQAAGWCSDQWPYTNHF
jgi:hypothetical protein